MSDYGKNRKYLKPTAIPTRHLNLNNESKDLVQFNDSDVIKKLLLDIPEVIECRGEACQQLFLTAKSLQTYNQRLISHIKSLEKRIDYLEEQTKKSTSTKFADAANDADFMLGPTQTRCLLNKVMVFFRPKKGTCQWKIYISHIINILFQTTKGRNWTVDEKEKAMKFKKMCSHRCYNFVRKNLVPLPCTWELNSSDNAKKNHQGKAEISTAVTEVAEAKKIVIWQEDLKSEMIEVQNIDEENQVIIVPPDLWTSNQKIEFIVNEITEINEIPQVSEAECQEDKISQRT